jgi:hypothetical protein
VERGPLPAWLSNRTIAKSSACHTVAAPVASEPIIRAAIPFAMNRTLPNGRPEQLRRGGLPAPDSRKGEVVPAQKRNRRPSVQMRRLFFRQLVYDLRVVWPILSGIVLAMVACGLAIWRIEGWRIDEALYFTFVTGLTIGYGDFTPKHFSARLLALVIGAAGVILLGVVAAVTVQALNAAGRDHED